MMKKKKYDRLKILTVAHIIISVTVVFLITAVSALLYFTNTLQDAQVEKIKLASGKKTQELNAFFNSAESIVNSFKDYILETLDEKRLLTDLKYEEKYMEELSDQMASMTTFRKGTVSVFFRMNIDKFGPTKGVFLTGSWQKSFVKIRTTDLSRYSPTDTENVGWYYLPAWKKEPVWTPPYSNENIGQKMISYCIPLYRDGNFLGVTGIDISLAALEETVNSLELEKRIDKQYDTIACRGYCAGQGRQQDDDSPVASEFDAFA